MNAVVQKARHPELQDYIHSTVSGLLPFIQKVDHSLVFFVLYLLKMVLNFLSTHVPFRIETKSFCQGQF